MASETNIRVIIFSTFIKIFQFLSKHVTASVGEPNLVIKPADPKGLRAESARAVTGRWCPHSGKGEDFLTGQLIFFF